VVRALAALVAVALVAFAGLWAWLLLPDDRPVRADAIVVLAGDEGRIPEGVRLFRQHVAPRLELSVLPTDGPALTDLCGRPGIGCFRASPYSTRGEARTFARLANRRGWDRVVIVSSRYHLRRSRMLFARCLPDATLSVVPGRTTGYDYLRNLFTEPGKYVIQLARRQAC
jgi:uncharacterized SAM-binding protein YcdF (DUF218 family)